MILNAREYNEKGSRIYDDAERLRKTLSNFMVKTNPAYKTAGFVSNPTPLPGEEEDEDADGEPEPEFDIETESSPAKRKPGRPPKNSSALRQSATPVLSESRYAEKKFSDLSFQQAQEKIVEDLIDYKEDPELVPTLSPAIILRSSNWCYLKRRFRWVRTFYRATSEEFEGLLSSHPESRVVERTSQKSKWNSRS